MLGNFELELDEVSVTPPVTDGSAAMILKPLSLRIREGEWITIVGANGSGKSTLLKVMAGMPMKGVGGNISRHGLRPEADSGAIPIVLQQPEAGIIGATPWEDVVAMLERSGFEERAIISAAEQALSEVGLGGRMRQKVETLSGGQKQLTAIAACLAARAPALLLDEVTAMLDPAMSLEVLHTVRGLHKAGTTVVWTTQRMEELRAEDRVLVLDSGEVVFEGTAESLFQRGNDGSGGRNQSAAERLGLEAPYSIRVAWELKGQGVELDELPFTPEQLAEAVMRYAG
ncbi:ATP-binding cassette domain-containing protein [Paenibacillus nanensis]|uniref:ATP-binding cassette domain-containing protein n=1 Tax=Paenibacillus nanensis TaxID=393251 RepID=A0A3A1UVG7_9BACL|nr:ATP-binding cassette domain-containing protein [Paenibacillus nanensis]RIX51746.1 ATP-binding cassette domain-containing protein [Paenibacillus nanensis]